jgi:NAD(P)-dependent dehydrogenase (short-subunit alcohol dehydrogenase family)
LEAGGIGSVTAQLFRSQGAKLALLYAPFEESKVTPTISRTFGNDTADGDIKAYACDVTDAASVQEAFTAITKDNIAFPSILINAAGYVSLQALETFDTNDILKHYMVNLHGPTLTGQAFARAYLAAANSSASKAPGGRIVNIASQAAHVALHHHGPYCASKAGLIGLTKCQASEWGPRGITSNSISPGPVWTELGKKAWGDPEIKDAYLKAVPTGQFAEPHEVARMRR